MKLSQLLSFSIIGAVVIVLISLGMDSIIKGLDDVLIPCQHGTEYNKLTGSCRCENTVFTGKYCGICNCASDGKCMLGGTTLRAGSDYGCRCKFGTKFFGFLCDMCFTENANVSNGTCSGACKQGYYGQNCDKTCKADLTFSDLTSVNPSNESEICLDVRTNGGKCNICSGHGACSSNGECECYTNWFDSPNGDCSRTCTAGGNGKICSGHGTCKSKTGGVPSCLCEYGWRGENCALPCPGSDVSGVPCSGHGNCLVDYSIPSTSCDCNQKFRGAACEIECPGLVTACSGHGTCDSAGICECNSRSGGITWEGNACQCNNIITCNGNGDCNPENGECECIGNYAGKHCNECKRNWYGSTCQFYCDPNGPPTGSSLGCFGRGLCNVLNEGLPDERMECECTDTSVTIFNDGKRDTYSSFYEQASGCEDCSPNYLPLVATVEHVFLTSGNNSESISATDCEELSVNIGVAFSTVDDSNKPNGCFLNTGADPNTAHYNNGGNVDCLDSLKCVQKGTTTFPEGIYVPCQLYCESVTCNNLGECNRQWGIAGEDLCHCESGSNNNKHLNDTDFCLSCENHWFPENVRSDEGCKNFCINDVATINGIFPSECDTGDIDCIQCSGNGHCGPEGDCLCDEGFTGQECDIECQGDNGLECSGHGKCMVNELQNLLQHEYKFLNESGALFSCQCDPQDPYTEEERINFRISVANNVTTGELEDPPIKTYYGDFCEYNCKSPPWLGSEVCNGFGACQITAVETPTGGIFPCTSDDECLDNLDLLSLLSGVSDWSSEKGPFCHKAESPPGCTTSNFTNDDCFYILSIQRPTKARSKECMRQESCRTYMDNNDWHEYCDEIQIELEPVANCPNAAAEFCELNDGNTTLDSSCLTLVDTLQRDDITATTQFNYCYEKDKARYPFKTTEEYRFENGVTKHDDVADEFVAFTTKYPGATMEATDFCTNYLKRLNVEVSHIRSDKLYVCDGIVQHDDQCNTEILELDTIRQPFYVHCKDGSETRYINLEDAITARGEGCIVVEEVVDVTTATLATLNSIKSPNGGPCVDNHDCFSNACYENTCCSNTTDTTNCATCASNGLCDCIVGSSLVNGVCTYDNNTCVSPSYWIDNVGCVNASFGQSCSQDKNCAQGVCYGSVCCSFSPNSAGCGSDGVTTSCITDATLVNGQCVPKVCSEDAIFVENRGCVPRPSDNLELQVQQLLDTTCANAQSVFPQCKYPTSACDINGISACKDGDTCSNSGTDAICETKGILNATCKFGLAVDRLSFSTYRCIGDFHVNDTCLREARDINWFGYCLQADPVRFHYDFGSAALQENHQPSHFSLETKQQGGDIFSFWVKTANVIKTSNPLLIKSNAFDIARVYLHQQQIQLNEIGTLQSCPLNQTTCNDNFMYNANEWLNIMIKFDYGGSKVQIHYNGNMKEDSFLCSNCVVNGITDIVIEAGNTETYYDEFLLTNHAPDPPVKSACSTYQYCDYNVNYRDKCVDMLINNKYPHTVQPQGSIVETCFKRKQEAEYIGAQNITSFMEDEMDQLDWITFCKFQKELDEAIVCDTLGLDNLEDFPSKCQPWIEPVDIVPANNEYSNVACIKNNLNVAWPSQCQKLHDAYTPPDMETNCPASCYKHLKGYDQCHLRDEIFSSNVGIPINVSGCSNIQWLNYCNDVAMNKHPGVCSAVECNCEGKNEGMTGESCELHCSIASDGSPCGVASGAGVCKYTKETEEQLAVGPYEQNMYEIGGECECFNSEGTSNCDQQCAVCTNTSYFVDPPTITIAFSTPAPTAPPAGVEEAQKANEAAAIAEQQYKQQQATAAEQAAKSEQNQKQAQSNTQEQTQKAQLQAEQASKQAQEQGTKSEQSQKSQQGGGGFGGGGYRRLRHKRLRSSENTYIYDGKVNPTIEICEGATVTFERSTIGHPLRVVKESDCTQCKEGAYNALPNSSLVNWEDVTMGNSSSFTFTESGTFYYLCTSHQSMVGVITVRKCGGQVGVCDASRGLCECLPPFTSETHQYYTTWKGETRSRLVRQFDLPGNATAKDEMRIRMMQGKKTFIRKYLNTDATDDDWRVTYDAFLADPSQYTCVDKPCDFHDTVLLGNLAETSWNYNYDCAKICPAVDPVSKIPCSGRGRCAISGSCICDPAKVIRGTDAATGSTFKINVFGGENYESNEFLVSKLDQTGWRGEDCAIRCPGYDDERQDMSEVCSGHGTCNGDGLCQCDIGFTGEVCQFTCPDFEEGDKNVCSGHGTCGLSEVQVYRDIFAEFNETYYLNGTAQTRTTNEQRSCPITASKEVCLGYSVINDIGYMDISRIVLVKEDSLCGSPTLQKCRKWRDYQNIYYRNRHPFEIDDETKPSGCIVDDDTIMYNNRVTQVTCEDGCLCEEVEERKGVCSVHDYIATDDGYIPITEWDGYYLIDAAVAPELSLTEYECEFYSNFVLKEPLLTMTAGLPSPSVSYEQCQSYVLSNIGSQITQVDDKQLPSGCVLMPGQNVYNVRESIIECSVNQTCVETPYTRVENTSLPSGCLNIGGTALYNLISTGEVCSESARCVEKRIMESQPTVIFHTDGGNKYTEELGKYSTGKLVWTGNMVSAYEDIISLQECLNEQVLKAIREQVGDKFSGTSTYGFGTESQGSFAVARSNCVYFVDLNSPSDNRVLFNTHSSVVSASSSDLSYKICRMKRCYDDCDICPECDNMMEKYVVLVNPDMDCADYVSEKELVSNVIAGPDTLTTIISTCDNDPDCGGYFPIIPDTEGTYMAVSRFDNELVEDRTESYRLLGLQAECTADLNLVVHEKETGHPSVNRGSISENQCRLYSISLGRSYETDYYNLKPTGCQLHTTNGNIYFNQQSNMVHCSATDVCFETVTRRKRDIGDLFYLDDHTRATVNIVTKEDCEIFAGENSLTWYDESYAGDTTHWPTGCSVYMDQNGNYNGNAYWKEYQEEEVYVPTFLEYSQIDGGYCADSKTYIDAALVGIEEVQAGYCSDDASDYETGPTGGTLTGCYNFCNSDEMIRKRGLYFIYISASHSKATEGICYCGHSSLPATCSSWVNYGDATADTGYKTFKITKGTRSTYEHKGDGYCGGNPGFATPDQTGTLEKCYDQCLEADKYEYFIYADTTKACYCGHSSTVENCPANPGWVAPAADNAYKTYEIIKWNDRTGMGDNIIETQTGMPTLDLTYSECKAWATRTLVGVGYHCPSGGTGSSGGYSTLQSCIDQGVSEGATHISYNADSDWCMRTTTCHESVRTASALYVIFKTSYDWGDADVTDDANEPRGCYREPNGKIYYNKNTNSHPCVGPIGDTSCIQRDYNSKVPKNPKEYFATNTMNWEQTKTYVEGKGGTLMTQAEIEANPALRLYDIDQWVAAYDNNGDKAWVQIGGGLHGAHIFGMLHEPYPSWGDTSVDKTYKRYVVYKLPSDVVVTYDLDAEGCAEQCPDDYFILKPERAYKKIFDGECANAGDTQTSQGTLTIAGCASACASEGAKGFITLATPTDSNACHCEFVDSATCSRVEGTSWDRYDLSTPGECICGKTNERSNCASWVEPYEKVGDGECYGPASREVGPKFEGNGDNSGADYIDRCAQQCTEYPTFIVAASGRCFCEDKYMEESACEFGLNTYEKYHFTTDYSSYRITSRTSTPPPVINNNCGSGGHACVKKRDTIFEPFVPANVDVDLNSCAKVCRATYGCDFYSIENGVCYMQDGCTVTADGSDSIYQLMSPEGGRSYTHFKKSKPTLCMSENGENFDEKTQAPVVRAINLLTKNCPDDSIYSALDERCVPYSATPKFDATFFLDKGTEFEKQLPVECQILTNVTARCALCSCFSDFIYGQWAGFKCDTCDVGYGKSQCRKICPDFDGDNRNTMCGGFGNCLFGSEINPDNGERLFQQGKCICGQSNQYAERQPTESITGTYLSEGGIDNDGAQVGYYYFTPVPYTQSFNSLFDAQDKCNEFNDLDNVDRGGFCFGVYRKYLSVTAVTPEVYLSMGTVGGSYYLYGKFWEKKAISGFAKFYNFKALELYNSIEGLPQIQNCKDILSIRSEGFDTCNHFAAEEDNPSCTSCAEGWTGKNCRVVCQKCLLGGQCSGAPSESMTSSCTCPQGAGALWENQCCPTGFMVADKVTWQSKSQSDVDSIRLSLVYDSSTTNELDASYYCKTCPGISHEDWMSPDALYKACSGPTRGTCEPVPGKLELSCNCRINAVTKNRWLGRACACDESIPIPYSTDGSNAESTDYGCLIPTDGNGVCPTSSGVSLFFNPPRVWGQDATYIVGETFGSPFLGGIAGQVFAIKKLICSPSSPCHTGEGYCATDDDCAGTLKCFIRNDGEEKLSFNAEKITYDMNYCYHEEETMVGCHPAEYDEYLNTREYNKQFYWDSPSNSYKSPELGFYVPYSQDANLNLVIHQQQFECPKGRYGITVPNKVDFELAYLGYCSGGTQTKMYEGNGDNPGSLEDKSRRCFEACMNHQVPLEGTWSFQAKSFQVIEDTGKCWCNDASSTCPKTEDSAYKLYNIRIDGQWNVCERCQPGKYQDTTGNIQIIRTYTGSNQGRSISEAECESYATWHAETYHGPPYVSAGFPTGCFVHSSGVYFQQTDQTQPCSNTAVCLQYGSGYGLAPEFKQPNCLNCPSGKFGGPVGSSSADLCEVCEPGQRTSDDGLSCVNCPAGRYEQGGVCKQCPNGQFSAEKHPMTSIAQPCNVCPEGMDTNGQIEVAGISANQACTFCPKGKYNGVAGGSCTNCAEGKYAGVIGKASCDLCQVGKFAHTTGRISCLRCGKDSPYIGLYEHTANRITCNQCLRGYVRSESGVTSGTCTACTPGYEQPHLTYQTSCKQCDAGEYTNTPGTGTCIQCELGKFQGSALQTSCDACSSGTYADVRGLTTCKKCATGKKMPSGGSSGPCVNCAAGQYQNQQGQPGCTNCYQGTFQNEQGKAACKYCAGGKYQKTGYTVGQTSSSSCSNCECGYACTAGQRSNCGPGSYSTGGAASCSSLSEHHYATGTNNCGQTRTCMSTIFAGAQGQCGSSSKCICNNISPKGSQVRNPCEAYPLYWENKYDNVEVCTTVWDALLNPKSCACGTSCGYNSYSTTCGHTRCYGDGAICGCTYTCCHTCDTCCMWGICIDCACSSSTRRHTYDCLGFTCPESRGDTSYYGVNFGSPRSCVAGVCCGYHGGYVTTCVTEKRFYLYSQTCSRL